VERRKIVSENKDVDDKMRAKVATYLDKEEGRAQNKCEFTSASGSAVIPMTPIYEQNVGIKSWGLKIFFNGKERTLQIDTSASGLTLVQSTGATLDLPKIEKAHMWGFGDEGSGGTILAKANSVRIGGLEFSNCEVEILDHTGLMGSGGALPGERLDATDGLVGTDIFDRYLVTVDYIKHEIRLAPLPQPQAGAMTAMSLDPLGGRTDNNWMLVDRIVDPSMQSWTKIYRRGHMLIVPTRITDPKGVEATTSSLSTQALIPT
jgi:hypothetical protein